MFQKYQQFEILVEEEDIDELKRKYGPLVPIRPDIIEFKTGHLAYALGQTRKDYFNNRISRLHIDGRPIEASIKPKISEVTYQIWAEPGLPWRLAGFNEYISIKHEHSWGEMDRAQDKSTEVLDMVKGEIRDSMNRKSFGEKVEPTFLIPLSVGASSLGYAQKFMRACREAMPHAYYIEVFQLNSLRKEVSDEEAERRFSTIKNELSLWSEEKHLKIIVNYPTIARGINSTTQIYADRIVFNERLKELLAFLIDFQSAYVESLRAGKEDAAFDLEPIRLFTQRRIMIVSSVSSAPAKFDSIEWLIDPRLFKNFLGGNSILDRVSITGLFGSLDMLNSTRSMISGGDIHAFALRSNQHERRYIVIIQLSEEEARELVNQMKNN
jgi:hypothetical protein